MTTLDVVYINQNTHVHLLGHISVLMGKSYIIT